MDSNNNANVIQSGCTNIALVTMSGSGVHQSSVENLCVSTENVSSRTHDDVELIVGVLVEELIVSVCLQESEHETEEITVAPSAPSTSEETEKIKVPRNIQKKIDNVKISETELKMASSKDNRKTGRITRNKRTMTEENTFIPSTDEESYGYVISTLRRKKREAKLTFAELRSMITQQYGAVIPNLRHIINEAIKNDEIAKSKGKDKRINYEMKVSGTNTDSQEGKKAKKPKQDLQENASEIKISELNVQYQRNETSSYLSVTQHRAGSTKRLVLDALRQMKQKKGVSAKVIVEHVNKKKRITLKEVEEVLNRCISNREVEKSEGKTPVYKLIP